MSGAARQIAITGATGLLGRSLLDRLLQRSDHRVRALSRSPQPAREGVEWLIGDVRDPEAVSRLIDGSAAVIHAAASLQGTADVIHDSIVTGTAVVAAAAHRAGIPLIHISSLAVIDPRAAARPIVLDDDAPRDPASAVRGGYTRGKVAAEAAVEQLVAAGLRAVMIRPGQLVSEQLRAVPPSLGVPLGPWRIALVSCDLPLAAVHVDDAADGILSVLDAAHLPSVVTLVDPGSPPRGTLLRRFARAGVPGASKPLLPFGPAVQTLAAMLRRIPALAPTPMGQAAERIGAMASRASWRCSAASDLGWQPHRLADWPHRERGDDEPR